MSIRVRMALAMVLAGVATLVQAKVQNGYVDGLVNVQERKPSLVSNEYGNSFFPGYKLSIKISGTIDINPTDRWEEQCFLSCKRREWVDHNRYSAEQWRVVFQLVDDKDEKVAEFRSQNGSAEFLIPTDVQAGAFNRRLRLEGMVEETLEGTPPIDGGRSRGHYSVQVFVDTSERVKQLPKYLTAAKPTARDLKDGWVNEPFLIEQNRAVVVRALINLAQTAYSPTDPINADEYRALLEYAAEIDPANTAVGAATADMYIQQGNFRDAEPQIVDTIKKLKQRPGAANDPGTQTSLARSYIKLATTVASARGYADAKDLSAILGYYTTAADIAGKFRAPVVQAEALFGRGYTQRSRNTPEALRAAQDDFQAARDRSPQPFPGVLSPFTAPDAEEVLVLPPANVLVTWQTLFDASPQKMHVDIGLPGLRAWAVSSNGKAYVSNDESLGVVRLGEPNATFDPMLSVGDNLDSVQTNGTYSILIRRAAPPVPPGGTTAVGVGPTLKLEMLRETAGGLASIVPIMFDGKPAFGADISSAADRYVVVGESTVAPPAAPVWPFELREITASGDNLLQRFEIRGFPRWPLKVSASGQRVVGIVVPAATPSQKVVVWDAQGGITEVVTNPLSDLTPSAPGGPPSKPPNLIISVDFTPDENGVVVVRADGDILTAPIAANASPTSVPRSDLNRTVAPVVVYRILPAGDRHLVIEGRDASSPFFQLFNPATKELRMVRVKEWNPLTHPVGFWKDGQNRVGAVHMELAPVVLRSVRTSDNTMVASGNVTVTDAPDIKLLKGGRFVCLNGPELGIKDLVSDSYSVIVANAPPDPGPGPMAPVMGPTGMPPVEAATCIARRAKDSWLLVRHVGGEIRSATKYVGQQPEADGAQNAMPAVPADIVDMNTAAAGRLNRPDTPPRFGLPFVPPHYPRSVPNVPGAAFLEAGGRMFAAAYPLMAMEEAMIKGTTQWVSVPYVFLQDAELAVKRMRLPLGALALSILPAPRDRVVYIFNNKVLWKPLPTDTDGKLLMEFDPTLQQIAINSNADRMMFCMQEFDPFAKKMIVEQKVFEITDSDVRPIACTVCTKRTLNTGNIGWGYLQTDAKMENLIIYQNDEHAAVYNVSTQRQVASLPFKQVRWLSTDRAYYISGPGEYSVIKY